ncbi:MAG TPA: hypothetical protein VK698_31890 [Kofleriaceae bacterium]|nr:hypothetical protein [Kofleriaceae bacterium]
MSSQKTLGEYVGGPPAREQVITECASLVDEEVKAKGGISGIAIKGAYGTVKTIKPRFVPEVIDTLLDEWVAKLEPYYAKWRAAGTGSLAEYLTARSDDVADDLLKVTDERAARTKHKTAGKLYGKMRPSAKRNVSAAVPKLGALMERHVRAADGAGKGS